jgi:uncharacterized protein YdaU (DUF1376 family)
MRAFLFYIDDWLASKHIAKMDAAEERGYLRLLLHAATEDDCGLPNDDAELAIISKLGAQWYKPTSDESKRIGDRCSGEKVRECFELVNGRLYNTRLLKEFLHQKEVNAKRVEAGKRGAKAKANAKQLLEQMHKQNASKREANAVANAVANGQANGKQTGQQNRRNDVCVSVSSGKVELPTNPDKEDKDNDLPVSEKTVSPSEQAVDDLVKRLCANHRSQHYKAPSVVRKKLLAILRKHHPRESEWPTLCFVAAENYERDCKQLWAGKEPQYVTALTNWLVPEVFSVRAPLFSGPPPMPKYVPPPIPVDEEPVSA